VWKLISFIKRITLNRFSLKWVGILSLLVIVWFVAQAMGVESGWHKLIIVSCILCVYFLVILLRWWWTKIRGEKLFKQLQSQQESLAGRELEAELLKEKMANAINCLKSSGLGVKNHGRSALYALPWFMIIGPSASGKSTLIRNSSLHFPLSSNEDLHVQGFGGTRNCDWWFADEAIILDTAGRYTTETEDHDEWFVFLQLLKKYRPRLPINGIIVTISLADILIADEDAISSHVKIIRNRIEEIYSGLGFLFPIYLTFTKCDLLKGFDCYFSDLSLAERQQVWGIDLEDARSGVEESLQQLYERLTQLRLRKLNIERNPKRKHEIYDFPEQFKAAIKKIVSFLESLSKDNPYQEQPHFIGAFFTSSVQEGLPIQQLIDSMGSGFGYDEKAAGPSENLANQSKSYFIHGVFTEVVFPNQYAIAKTHQQLKIQKRLKTASIGIAMTTIGAAFLLYSRAYTDGVDVISQGQLIATQLTRTQSPSMLLRAFRYYQQLNIRRGLYPGHELSHSFQGMLFDVMQSKFLAPVSQQLEEELERYQQQWAESDPVQRETLRGSYYTTLKLYLMLCFPKRIDLDQAVLLLNQRWAQLMSIANDDLYMDLVRFYLSSLKNDKAIRMLTIPWQGRTDLLSIARHHLQTSNNAQNLYAQIRSTGLVGLPSYTLQKLIQGDGENLLISDKQLPGIFTYQGWKQYIEPEINKVAHAGFRGDWVMGVVHDKRANAMAEKRLVREIRRLYFDDYTRAWLQFINAVRVRRFSSLNDATKALSTLAKQNSPIVRLLHALSENIKQLGQDDAGLHSIANLNINNGVGDPLKAYLHELVIVQNDMQRLAASPDVQRDAQHYASRLLTNAGGDTELYRSMVSTNVLANSLDKFQARKVLRSLLLQPTREAWRILLHTAIQGLEKDWQTQVFNNYQRSIYGKFPFAKTSREDVVLSDVGDFFQPHRGVLWKFVDHELNSYLLPNQGNWKIRKWLGIGANFSQQFLSALTHAKHISHGLFEKGSSNMGFYYHIYPKPSPNLMQIDMVIDGQSYRYQNGPQEWRMYHWPAPDADQGAYLSALATHGNRPNTLECDGPWGLFHLLAKSRLIHLRGSIYEATWRLKSAGKHVYPVHFQFQTDRNNVFEELLLSHFYLPSRLFTIDRVI